MPRARRLRPRSLAGCGASDDPGAPAPLPLGPGTAAQPADGRPRRREDRRPARRRDDARAPAPALRGALRAAAAPTSAAHADGERRDGVGAGARLPGPGAGPGAPRRSAAMAAAQLCLLNGERADAGLPPLTLNAKLSAAATRLRAGPRRRPLLLPHRPRRLDDPHAPRRRRLPARATRGWAIGENLAWGTGALATPGSIMQAWMNSAGAPRTTSSTPSTARSASASSSATRRRRRRRARPTRTPSASSTSPPAQAHEEVGQAPRQIAARPPRSARPGRRASRPAAARAARAARRQEEVARPAGPHRDLRRTGTSKRVRSSSNSEIRAASSSRHAPAGESGAPPTT